MTHASNAVPSRRVILAAQTAGDLMRPDPVSVRAEATLQEAIRFLTDRGFSAAPVIDEAGRPVGVLSLTDIVIHDRETIKPGNALPAFYVRPELEECPASSTPERVLAVDAQRTRVRDLMTPAVFSISTGSTAARVVEEMLALKVHRLFAVDQSGVLVGVISALDVLRRLQEEPA
jgi:CBS domain-containing protein